MLVQRDGVARQNGNEDKCFFVGHDGCGCRDESDGDAADYKGLRGGLSD